MGEAQRPGPSASLESRSEDKRAHSPPRGGIGKGSPGALWLAKGPRSPNQQFGKQSLWACIHGISCVLAADLKFLQ